MEKIIIASGPVIVEDGNVLLAKHGNDDFWKFCGGKTDDALNLAENMKRNVKGEMGIDVIVLDEEPYLMHVKKPGEEHIDVLLVHFLVKRVGEIIPNDKITAWQWFPVNNLPADAAPNIKPVLEHFKDKI